MASPQELADLLSRCALNDRKAFEQLYRSTAPQLFGLVIRIVKNPDLADEVLQEGYLKIWAHARDFRPDKAAPMTWMGSIMRNQAIDQIRRAAARPALGDPIEELHWLADETNGPVERVDQAQMDENLHACIERLEGPQRRAMILAYFHGLTHEELAEHLQRPLGTVKSWIRRGLMRLKQCLDER